MFVVVLETHRHPLKSPASHSPMLTHSLTHSRKQQYTRTHLQQKPFVQRSGVVKPLEAVVVATFQVGARPSQRVKHPQLSFGVVAGLTPTHVVQGASAVCVGHVGVRLVLQQRL